MSGNMSEAGLTKDLEAMAETGIGGIILFNVSHIIPKGKVIFNSPQHTRLTVHAAKECERLGLTFGLHNCDGWTSSGGPWITPENAMKLVVHSKQVIDGGQVDVEIAKPAAREGFYRDVAVLAYPALDSEISDEEAKPTVTSSDPDFDISLATDGRADRQSTLAASEEEPGWIQFDYHKPYTIRSLHYSFDKKINGDGKSSVLLTSDDGKTFKESLNMKIKRLGKVENSYFESFPEGITARYFRIQSTYDYDVMEIDLSASLRFQDMLARYSIFKRTDDQLKPLSQPSPSMIVNQKDIIDLSDKMDPDGNLSTELPPGKWMVMRFGYTITAAVNSPASTEGTGLEVDKMSRSAMKVHYDAYCGKVIRQAKALAPNALQYMEIDSYEVGGQNWTRDYEKMFSEQYGYDIQKFLPLYAGRFIDSAETTDRLLWDIRQFNSQMMVENYFDYFTELCHADGLISYVEPYSFNAAFSEIDAARNVDVPMGEFWMHDRYQYETAVSAAHLYGRPVVSAEAFSAQPDINFKGHPGTLKKVGDKAWTLGLNEFMFHRFAHQANTHVIPGMTMSQWGSHIDRTQTWWDTAGKSWFKYLQRGQYMLQKGIPVRDLLVFVGDGAPANPVSRPTLKGLPENISFDSCNPHALATRVSVKDGKLVLPNGVQYDAIVLRNSTTMTLSTLKKIDLLSRGNAVIIGARPTTLAGYGSSPEDIAVFKSLVSDVWKRSTTYQNAQWDQIFEKHDIVPDLVVRGRDSVDFIHKKIDATDLFFISNQEAESVTFECEFDVDQKVPERWDPITGQITSLLQFTNGNGKTNLSLDFDPHGSAFILFRRSSDDVFPIRIATQCETKPLAYLNSQGASEVQIYENGLYNIETAQVKTAVEVKDLPDTQELDQPWKVEFDAKYGFDQTLDFDQLTDWKDHELEAVRHYSGTAIYRSSFTIQEVPNEQVIELNLGDVAVAATVTINGRQVGTVWKRPYRLDISDAVQRGENQLSVKVANLWSNRLIGDKQYPDKAGVINQKVMPDWYTNNEPQPETKRFSFCAFDFYEKNDPLLSSGLIGPVKLIYSKRIVLQ